MHVQVNASIAGATVQCDFLMRIEILTVPLPRILYGILPSNLQDVSGLGQALTALQLVREALRKYSVLSTIHWRIMQF